MNIRPLLDDGTTRPVSPWPSTSEDTTSFIIRRAMELVNELVKYRGQEEPPFLAEELAHLQGIKVMKEDLGDVGAFLIRSPDGYTIKVNANHHPYRQNFSCAHEIGHTFLHELDRLPRLDNYDDNEFRISNLKVIGKAKEDLCHTAAAELLMPKVVFNKYLINFGISVNSIKRLSQIFRVSFPAAAIRISQVSAEPCSVILWKQCQKSRSKGFFGYFMKKPMYIRNHSPMSRAFESDRPVKSFKSFEIYNVKKRCLMESKAFGQGKMRYVISVVFPES
jgi:Zn-dependent peptidase ImmA (M78 family)